MRDWLLCRREGKFVLVIVGVRASPILTIDPQRACMNSWSSLSLHIAAIQYRPLRDMTISYYLSLFGPCLSQFSYSTSSVHFEYVVITCIAVFLRTRSHACSKTINSHCLLLFTHIRACARALPFSLLSVVSFIPNFKGTNSLLHPTIFVLSYGRSSYDYIPCICKRQFRKIPLTFLCLGKKTNNDFNLMILIFI